jgi:D-3-phosphoglycerate dehydrogenase
MEQDLKGFTVAALEPMDSFEYDIEALRKRGAEIVYGHPVSRSDLRYTEDQVIELCKGADAILMMTRDPITPKVLDACPKLRIISKYGRGIDHLPLEAAAERGIIIANTPTTHSGTVAEFSFMLMLMVMRDFVNHQEKLMKQGKWRHPGMGGLELKGKTVGLIGLGSIGKAMARRLAGWEVKILASDPNVTKETAAAVGVALVDQDTLLAQSDVISLHASLLPSTRHMIGKNEFAKMKDGVFLVNNARGALIDTEALIDALKSRKIAAAGLDVFEYYPLRLDDPLRNFENVILTPHESGTTDEANTRVSEQATENIATAFLGAVPERIVNTDAIVKWKERFAK